MQISTFAQSATMRSNLAQIQSQLADLERQMSTGIKADSFSALGDGRNLVLSLNNQISQSKSYLDTINATQTRIKASSDALTRINDIASELKTGGLTSQFELTAGGQTSLQTTSGMRLSEVVDLLNLNVADRQLFGGKNTQTTPVENADLMLNGDTLHAGLKQVISERAQADLGDGHGRLVLSSPASGTVSLAEDASPSPYGFKIANISSSLSGTTVTGPAGSPAAVSVAFGASLPNEGESVSVDLNLPDGTKTTVKLTATTANPPGKDQFTIGADAATTAANFQSALDSSVQTTAQTTLKAASAVQAGNDFFSNPPVRVTGPNFSTATTSYNGSSLDTVIWYKGDTSGTPGNNFIATIGDGSQVAYGARADQSALRSVVQSAAVLAAVSYSSSDPNAEASYAALTTRTSSALSFTGTQSVEDVVTDLGLKSATLDTSKNNLQTQISTSQTLLDNTQNADTYAVATKLTSLVTQLQASYQVTAALSKLSLANYL